MSFGLSVKNQQKLAPLDSLPEFLASGLESYFLGDHFSGKRKVCLIVWLIHSESAKWRSAKHGLVWVPKYGLVRSNRPKRTLGKHMLLHQNDQRSGLFLARDRLWFPLNQPKGGSPFCETPTRKQCRPQHQGAHIPKTLARIGA